MKKLFLLLAFLISLSVSAQRQVAPWSWIPFVHPGALVVQEQSYNYTINLSDSRQISSMSSKNFCQAILNEMNAQLSDKKNMTLVSLAVNGYSTPIGNYRRNEQNWSSRSQELKDYLVSHQLARNVSVTWTSEDWQRIIQLTAADHSIRLGQAALDVMENVAVTEGREDQLRMLAGGETYRQLQQRVFPQVDRIEYTATFAQNVTQEGSAMNLRSLYETAARYERGSAEYNDILDLAARLNPTSGVAAINAAGVALSRGDLSKAEHYLQPWQTDARAYQNLGVLHFLKGDTEKAEVYLRLASSLGVSEAALVLTKIHYTTSSQPQSALQTHDQPAAVSGSSLVRPADPGVLPSEAVIGSVVAVNGRVYTSISDATTFGGGAVAMVAYRGNRSDCKNGLAIALADEPETMDMTDARQQAASHLPEVNGGTWRLPTSDDLRYIFEGCGGSRYDAATTNGPTYSYGNLRALLKKVSLNCDLVSDNYWTSTVDGGEGVKYNFGGSFFYKNPVKTKYHVRAVLSF